MKIQRNTVMKPEDLTIQELEKASGFLTDDWHGKCTQIASVASSLVNNSKYIFGHYTGYVNPVGYWKTRCDHAFVQHGWVLLNDGRVLDPTRFSFENADPYIFIGSGEDYDETGDKWRQLCMRPCPEPQGEQIQLNADNTTCDLIEELTDSPISELTFVQYLWIANLPYEVAHPVYKTLIENKMQALIPIDCRRRAERENKL